MTSEGAHGGPLLRARGDRPTTCARLTIMTIIITARDVYVYVGATEEDVVEAATRARHSRRKDESSNKASMNAWISRRENPRA